MGLENHEEQDFIALPRSESGFGSVADIYISKHFDLNASVTPSDGFIGLSSTEDISENTRSILCEVFKLDDSQFQLQ
jgi:hypothetical protein